ncbi:hypothetical protein ABIB15_000879 [Marisediminicola sp. UYEF4]|uniref:hypothetical protein n=1 Tax=Marisediminicola sp. UYEF4 TaxID=1756384 RepID=UPI00339110AA
MAMPGACSHAAGNLDLPTRLTTGIGGGALGVALIPRQRDPASVVVDPSRTTADEAATSHLA